MTAQSPGRFCGFLKAAMICVTLLWPLVMLSVSFATYSAAMSRVRYHAADVYLTLNADGQPSGVTNSGEVITTIAMGIVIFGIAIPTGIYFVCMTVLGVFYFVFSSGPRDTRSPAVVSSDDDILQLAESIDRDDDIVQLAELIDQDELE